MVANAEPPIPGLAAESDSTEHGSHLLYLYCVVEADSDAHQRLKDGSVGGMEETEPLFAVEIEGLVAAVSRVPAVAFQEEALNEITSDLRRLAPYAIKHEEAISALTRVAPAIVPMAFGAVYRDTSRVAQMLREGADHFRSLLEQVRGKQEWGVKVFCDHGRLRQTAESTSEALRQSAAELAEAGPGRAYLLNKQRERLIASEAETLLNQILVRVFARLSAVSASARQDSLSAGPSNGAVDLVLKAVFLVPTDRVDDFQRTVDELRAGVESSGVTVEVNGPWAPYSFVNE